MFERILFFFALGFTVATIPAPAATLQVNNASGAACSDATGAPYCTIQAAMNAAQAGDTIEIAAGTYVEQVVIAKNLTIAGAGVEQTTIQAPEASFTTTLLHQSILRHPVLFVKNGASVTITNLRVDGLNRGDGVDGLTGIAYHNASGSVHGIRVAAVGGSNLTSYAKATTIGIVAVNSDGAARTISVTNCIVDGFHKEGIAFVGSNLSATVSGNQIVGEGDISTIAQNGIRLERAVGTISGNTITAVAFRDPGTQPLDDDLESKGIFLRESPGSTVVANTVNGLDTPDGIGIAIEKNSHNVLVGNNTITDHGFAGIEIFGEILTVDATGEVVTSTPVNGVTIVNNSLLSNNSPTGARPNLAVGINIHGDTQNVTVANNLVADNDFGISVIARVRNTSITNNTIRDNRYGVEVIENKEDPTEPRFNSLSTTVRFNGIYGNSVADVSNVRTTNFLTFVANETPVIAALNWFNVANPSQIKIAGAVDFTPMLANGDSNAADGFQEDIRFVAVHVLGTQNTPGAPRIQEAMNLAGTTDIALYPGTYAENFAITRDNTTVHGATGVATDVIIKPASGNGIAVAANDVTIANLRVTGAVHGINAENIPTLTLSNVQLDKNTGYGFRASQLSALNLANIRLFGNLLAGGTVDTANTVEYVVAAGTVADSVTIGSAHLFHAESGGDRVLLTAIGTLAVHGGDGADTFNVGPGIPPNGVITLFGENPSSGTPGDAFNFVEPSVPYVHAGNEISGSGIATTAYAGMETVRILSQKVRVEGNGQLIGNGSSVPELSNHTEFDGTTQGQSGAERMFTVTNTLVGTSLSVSGLTVTGDFAIAEELTSTPLDPNASDTFRIQLDTTTKGNKFGTVHFTVNDGQETLFFFAISGTVAGPEIAVQSNGQDIANGMDFGTVIQGTAPPSSTFTIRNTGDSGLMLTDITLPSGYSLPATIAFPITVGELEQFSFTITLATTTAGTFAGNVTIANDDEDEGTFAFAVSGKVITPAQIAVSGKGQTIANGATTTSAATGTEFGFVLQGTAAPVSTYTIRNEGEATLTIVTIAVPAGFQLIDPKPLDFPIDLSGSSGRSELVFSVALDISHAAVSRGPVTIETNGVEDGEFVFTISGAVLAPLVSLDVDRNGQVDVRTDGMLILRYMFGFRDNALIDGALATDPPATITDPKLLELLLDGVNP